ncbi:9496_t:CDS:2 [Rhizophagus irregularis]|nr:9496_t:CDS:2 [Rhizophagus irregularis]
MSSSNPTVVINNYGPMRRIRRNGYRQRNTNGVYHRRNIQLNVSDTSQEDTLNRIVNFPRQQGVNNQLNVRRFLNCVSKRHSEAIYTSRSLQEYITKAYEFDINNTPSSSSPSLNFTIQNPSTTHNQNAINTNRLIISRKRKIEESNVEIHDNGRKCIKINKSQ